MDSGVSVEFFEFVAFVGSSSRTLTKGMGNRPLALPTGYVDEERLTIDV